MAEFTGERVIPGEVDVDLMNEHLARYTFAARLSTGKRVLDAGCGAGYGSAELAHAAHAVVGIDCAAEAVRFARDNYRLPNLQFEQATCRSLPHRDCSFDLVVAFEVAEHAPDPLGLPMSPFFLLQMVGPAVALHVGETLAAAYPDRFTVSPKLRALVAAGKTAVYRPDFTVDESVAALLAGGDRPSTAGEVRERALEAL